MYVLEDEDEAVIKDATVGRRQGGGGDAGAKFFEDVVEASEGQMGMVGEDALAVGVEVLGDAADAGLLQVVGGGEGEGIEAGCFDVDGIVADAEPAAR